MANQINNQFGLLSAPGGGSANPLSAGTLNVSSAPASAPAQPFKTSPLAPAPATTATNYGPTQSPTLANTFGSSWNPQPVQQTPTVNPNAAFQTSFGGVSGLVSPQHPSGTVASSTITTNPDMSTQHKVTYDTASGSGQASTQSTNGTQTQASPYQILTGGPAIPNAVNQYQPTEGLYGQLTTGLANTASAGSPMASQLIGGLGGTSSYAAGQGATQEQQAYDAAQQYLQQLQQSQSNEANTVAGIKSQPIPLEFQQGQAQVVQSQYQQQQAALASALQGEAALGGLGANVLGTGVQGYGTGANAALTGQSLAQQGLGAAGALASPQFPAYTSAGYNPVTGTYSTVGGGQYGSGPAAAANIASIQAQTQQVNDWSSARSAANQLVNSQLTPLLQQNNVNPSDFNAVNRLLQAIAGQTSNPQYKQLQNLMTDVAQTYAQVLTPPGQSPSVWISQTAQGLLDSTASGQSIQQVIGSLDAQAYAKIYGVQQTVNALQTGGNVNPAVQSQSQGNPYDPANYNIQ